MFQVATPWKRAPEKDFSIGMPKRIGVGKSQSGASKLRQRQAGSRRRLVSVQQERKKERETGEWGRHRTRDSRLSIAVWKAIAYRGVEWIKPIKWCQVHSWHATILHVSFLVMWDTVPISLPSCLYDSSLLHRTLICSNFYMYTVNNVVKSGNQT